MTPPSHRRRASPPSPDTLALSGLSSPHSPKTNRAFSLGVGIPQVLSGPELHTSELSQFVSRTEALGFETGWVMDQFLGQAAFLAPIPLLAFAAAKTTTLRLGFAVLLPVHWNPIQLAKSLATLDQLTAGRLTIGVALGADSGPGRLKAFRPGERVGRFEESIKLMKLLWTHDPATFDGKYWTVTDASMNPKPFQHPHPPLWFGGGSTGALRRCASLADGWIGAGTSPATLFGQQVASLRELLESAGREVGKFAIAKRAYVGVTSGRLGEASRIREWFERVYSNADLAHEAAIVGDAGECAERLQELLSLGANHLILNPVIDELDQLEELAHEVVPRLSVSREP